MLALGCIQALKCNTNRCPTGVATQDPELMARRAASRPAHSACEPLIRCCVPAAWQAGLVPEDKALRVYRYHHATVHSALELVGAMGLTDPAEVTAHHIMRRTTPHTAVSLAELYPPAAPGSLLAGGGPRELAVIELDSRGRWLIQTLDGCGRSVLGIPAIENKIVRAKVVSHLAETGRVHVCTDAAGEALVATMCAFPNAKLKDLHDACVHGLRRLNESTGAVEFFRVELN